jgi:4-hydroxybenzoate polyprenyltransferase
MAATLSHILTLTRWREFIPFVIPLTILGALLAHTNVQTTLDYRLFAVCIANVLCVAYAFMINDIEDAPDDARDPARAHKNVIANGKLQRNHGLWACRATFLLSLAFYVMGGTAVIIVGVIALLLSHFYSWKPVRLKAWPVTDVISHVLMLSGLLMIAGYYTYSVHPGKVWWVIAAATFFS